MNSALTFDIDWAPDWVINDCYMICKELGVSATFFVTHQSDMLDVLRSDPEIELGVHPNLMPGTTHGENEHAVLEHCMEIVPEAKAMRTHGLYQATNLYSLIADYFPMIETDVSLYLAGHKELHPVDIYCGRMSRRITRLPYFWEDDFQAVIPDNDWKSTPKSDGLRIFDFHPVHVMLNMSNLEDYFSLKKSLGSRNLQEATRNDFSPYVNKLISGAQTFLKHMVADIGADQFTTISSITREYRENISL